MLKKFILSFSILLLLTSCTPSSEPTNELIEINLPMGYIPDPQYAPFYVAVANGYYEEAGFSLTFDYSFETDGMALVGSNQRPFALVSGEQVILARAQELPVVFVMEWFQKYPIAVVSKESANINTPADLANRSVGLPGFFGASYVGYSGLLSTNNIDPTSVDSSEIGFNQIEALLTDQVDAVVVYANNEPVRLTSMGESINQINVSDFVDMVANGLISNEETINNNPELVEAFVAATLKGLADTIADPKAAYEISKQFVEGLDDSRFNVLEASIPLWTAPQLGYTDPESWRQTEKILVEIGFLDAPLTDLEKAYDNQFLP